MVAKVQAKDSEELSHEYLKAKQRRIRESFPPDMALKVHRALSWLHRAEQCDEDDKDSQFLFLWIAFNATYDDKGIQSEGTTEARKQFVNFFDTLISVDTDNRVYDKVWNTLSGPFNNLVKSEYVFPPFWKSVNGQQDEQDWKKKHQGSIRWFLNKVGNTDTVGVLSEVFGRLYVLRNQLIHGGATWKSSVNKYQVADCSRILTLLVPLMVDIVMDNPHENWGVSYYPNLSRE